jgi:restriction system protein
MARRSGSIFEDIADITSRLPWWVGVSLALVSFFFLQRYAGTAIPAVTGTGGLYENVLPGLLRSLAFFGQFIVPAAFLLGSVASVILNYKRAKLYGKTSRSAARNPLNDLSWRDFEFLVGEYFRRRQFTIKETKIGGDGGVDLIAKKGSEKFLVQCKHWKADKVGVNVVQELPGVMVDAGATNGIIVTSGEFTKDASAFARANNIRLLDGRELHNNMKSDVNFEHQPERETGRKLQRVKWIFAGFLVIAVGYSLFINIEMNRESEEQKYLYEIEFVSGGRVYTDNVKTTDKEIIYQTAQGLVVSLNKHEVKTMKKTRVAK